MKKYFVYILTNKSNRVLYIGMTNNLPRRIWEHKQRLVKGFTQKYNCTKLVYFEETESVHAAIEREKQLKNWRRQWKINLIAKNNPDWEDLAEKFNLLRDAEPRDPETSSGRQERDVILNLFQDLGIKCTKLSQASPFSSLHFIF